MDEYLLAQWNNCVGESDTVYILGDLFFRNAVSANGYLNRLHGKKHLIKGNHDKDWMKKADLEKHFESVSSMLEISDGAHKITLCHYPGCMGEQQALACDQPYDDVERHYQRQLSYLRTHTQ